MDKRKTWIIVALRAASGTMAYTCVVFAVMYIPVFVFAIILNTSPFITALLGWIMSGESVSKIELLFMFASFGGITFLVVEKEEKIT